MDAETNNLSTFDSFNLLNTTNHITDLVMDMIKGEEILDYPVRGDAITVVGTKRKCIKKHLSEQPCTLKANLQQQITTTTTTNNNNNNGSSSHMLAPQKSNKNNMSYFKIIHPLLTEITCKFLEVQARLCSNDKFKNVSPNRIGCIHFLNDLQHVVEENLLFPLMQELKNVHEYEVDSIGMAMYVGSHKQSCKLPCKAILAKRNSMYANECLLERITLGSYYFPFLSRNENNKDFDEKEYPGILGILLIHKNSCILGVGSSHINMNEETFVECQEPVHAIISFQFQSVGVFQSQAILYLKAVDHVYYSNCKITGLKSGKEIIMNKLLEDTTFQNKIRVKCCLTDKKLPTAVALDYNDTEAVDRFVDEQEKKKLKV